jgi:hypothetical protein
MLLHSCYTVGTAFPAEHQPLRLCACAAVGAGGNKTADRRQETADGRQGAEIGADADKTADSRS